MKYTMLKYMKNFAAAYKDAKWTEENLAKLRSLFTTLCMMCSIEDHERATIIYDLNLVGKITERTDYKKYYSYMVALL